MTDTKAPDQGLRLAGDGRLHTDDCVNHGWWRLDWEVDCVTQGTPPGGAAAAQAERALFATAVAVLQLVALLFTLAGGARRGR